MIGFSDVAVNLDILRRHIEARLCELGSLEPAQFPITQREVIRKGQTCALYFCLHGPRSVKLTAIADLARRSLVFYGSDGVRHDVVAWDDLGEEPSF
ncbi:MAG: hypothetical protein AAGJ40_13560 [Planctomycetota bacterium]